MTNDFNAGRTALDKVNELEKRLAYSAAQINACAYGETQREISLASSEVEKNVILNYEWNFFKKEASLLNFAVTTPQKGAVNIKLDFNGGEIFNGAMTDGTATLYRGGTMKQGKNTLKLTLYSSAAFSCAVAVTVKGYFKEQIPKDELSLCGDEYFTHLSRGRFSLYDCRSKARVITVYGVKFGCAVKLADGNFLFALKKRGEKAKLMITDLSGNIIKQITLDNAPYTFFGGRPNGSGAIIYAAAQGRLKVVAYDGENLTEEQTSVRCAKVGCCGLNGKNMLSVLNPLNYAFAYEVE